MDGIGTTSTQGLQAVRVRLIFQSLLANRFNLRIHRVTQKGNGYSLRLANSRTTPKASLSFREATGHVAAGCSIQGGGTSGNHLLCRDATSGQIANLLARHLGPPVADQTDKRGKYDCDIVYASDDALDTTYPSLIAAIRDVLKLRLIRGVVPVEMLVIDRLEKPSEN